jgi:hypothetical protein
MTDQGQRKGYEVRHPSGSAVVGNHLCSLLWRVSLPAFSATVHQQPPQEYLPELFALGQIQRSLPL